MSAAEASWLDETSVEHLEGMDEEKLADMYHRGYEYRESPAARTRLVSILVHLRDEAARSAENAGAHLADTLVNGYQHQIASTSLEALKHTLAARRDGIRLARRRASQRSLGESSRTRSRTRAGEGSYRMRRIYFGEG